MSANGLDWLSRSGWFTVLVVVLCLAVATLAAACGGGQDTTGMADVSGEIRSDKERTAPPAENTDLVGLIDG